MAKNSISLTDEEKKARMRAWVAKYRAKQTDTPEKRAAYLVEARARDAQRRAKRTPEQIARKKATDKAWRENHQKSQSSKARTWRKENYEQYRDHDQKWKKANPHRIRAYASKRRAAKLASNGTHTADDLLAIFSAQRGRCAICARKIKKGEYHVDHIKALAKGGSNARSNIQIACPLCNMQKRAEDPITFMQSLGRLL